MSDRGLNPLVRIFELGTPRQLSALMAIIGFLTLYFGVINNNDRPMYVAILITFVAVYVFYISLRVYLSDYKPRDIIPRDDRDLLTDIIQQRGKNGIDVYIKLSSLTGFTGTITKLGLTGLPLLTVALTVFFTVLATFLYSIGSAQDQQSIILQSMMDLAKLTLGAFIGSFVQRNVSSIGEDVAAQGRSADQPIKPNLLEPGIGGGVPAEQPK
jgi:hypothetical protein